MLEPDESAGGVSHTWLSGEVGEEGEGANLRFNINFVEFRLVHTDTKNVTERSCWGEGGHIMLGTHRRHIKSEKTVTNNDFIISVTLARVYHKMQSAGSMK